MGGLRCCGLRYPRGGQAPFSILFLPCDKFTSYQMPFLDTEPSGPQGMAPQSTSELKG